jgi:hypothetical protein
MEMKMSGGEKLMLAAVVVVLGALFLAALVLPHLPAFEG